MRSVVSIETVCLPIAMVAPQMAHPTTAQATTTSTAYPATINVLAAQVVPSGSLIQGLPEL